MKSLPDPFPIDPPVRPPSRTALAPAESAQWFDRVYSVYPNKNRKQVAHEAWRELNPDLGLAERIVTDVQHRVRHGWVKFERRFIPQLVRYLTERHWEDAVPGDPGVLEADPYALLPYAWQCTTCGEIHEGTPAQFRAQVCLERLARDENK